MKTWKHITEDNRKNISSCISHNKKLIEISNIIGYDPRAISKEVRRNRNQLIMLIKRKVNALNLIDGLTSVLIVKTGTSKCSFVKFVYDSKTLRKSFRCQSINSRKGIDLDSDEFNKLDSIIKKGIDENKSIYQISRIENK